MNLQTYIIRFDGSAKPNPGMMTSAYLIYDSNENLLCSETIKGDYGTSNLAEYIGLYSGLQKAKELGFRHIEVYGDSELVINQLNGEYKCKKATLKEYKEKIENLLNEFWTYKLTHVKRKFNKAADKLCRKG